MATRGVTAPDGVMDAAITTVMDQMDKLESVSGEYRAQLSSALDDIKDVKVEPIDSPKLLNLPETPAPTLSFDQRPEFSAIGMDIPQLPVFQDISGLLADLDLSDLNIPAAPEMPAIEIPAIPSINVGERPSVPDVDFDLQIPDLPDLQLPELSALQQIQVPEFTFEQLPDFDGLPPDAANIKAPEVFIDWDEPEYESEILEDIVGKVKRWMKTGGTGLPANIENALFSRTRSRQSKETERAVQEAVSDWSSRNFTMPPGMLVKQVAAIREQGGLQAADLNREIMIEAAKWEIENMRFMVQQGIALEQMNQNLHSNLANRLLEVAKLGIETKINVFNAEISLFNIQNAAFETLSSVYKTKLEGALAKLTAYKTQVEAQSIVGQLNEQMVQVYRAKMEAVASNVELYKAKIQGASIRSDIIKNRFDAYRSEVQAFGELIAAEKTKVDAYEAQTRAESAKASIFDAQARAYASTIQAVQAKAGIKSDQIRLKMEAAKTWISKYAADVDGYKAGLQAKLSEIQNNTAAFSAQVEAWRAGAGVSISNAEMQSRFADMNTRTNIQYSQMQISEYQAKSDQIIKNAQIALESAKALGQYTAQLAAGAMSAAHVSASISGSGSTSTSSSRSDSKSENHNYNY